MTDFVWRLDVDGAQFATNENTVMGYEIVSYGRSLSQRISTVGNPGNGNVTISFLGHRRVAGAPFKISLIDMSGSWVTLEQQYYDTPVSTVDTWHTLHFNSSWVPGKVFGIFIDIEGTNAGEFSWAITTVSNSKVSLPLHSYQESPPLGANVDGKFGQIRVGSWFNHAVLPDPTAFDRDKVRQGAYHEMLSGKWRRDILGKREHFALEWTGLTQAEADTLQTLWDAALVSGRVVTFTCSVGAFNVIVANSKPETWDDVGYISTGVVLEETR